MRTDDTEGPESSDGAREGAEKLNRALGRRSRPGLPERYELVRQLGRGGMGVVYLAKDRTLNRPVAVKVLRSALATDKDVARFRREAKMVGGLRHAHVVPILDYGVAGEEPYYTMPHIAGASLAALMEGGSLTPRRAAELIAQAAEGVHHAHRNRIIHRDLKPANILIDGDGEALVADFGLALDLAASRRLTKSSGVVGTAAYMAPEQASKEFGDVGARTDVHALGVILYEALTRRLPHGEGDPKDPAEVLLAVARMDAVPPRQLVPGIPKDLETICLKALEKEPRRRYVSAQAMAEDLRRWLDGEEIVARPPSLFRRGRRFCRRHWKPLFIAAAAVFLAVRLWPTYEKRATEGDARAAEARRHDAVDQALDEATALGNAGQWAQAVRRSYAATALADDEEMKRIQEEMKWALCGIDCEDARAYDSWKLLFAMAPDQVYGEPSDHQAYRALLSAVRTVDPSLSLAVTRQPGMAELLLTRMRIERDKKEVVGKAREVLERDHAEIVGAMRSIGLPLPPDEEKARVQPPTPAAGREAVARQGIVVHVERAGLRDDRVLHAILDLKDKEGGARELNLRVDIGADGVGRVEAPPGRYVLCLLPLIADEHASEEETREGELTTWDLADLPAEVEVGSGWVELPTIYARRRSEITGVKPEDGGDLDPRSEAFRWEKTPGAVAYRLTLRLGTVPSLERTRTAKVVLVLTGTEVCLGKEERSELGADVALLEDARAAEWTVEAIDAKDEISATSTTRRVRLTHGLSEK